MSSLIYIMLKITNLLIFGVVSPPRPPRGDASGIGRNWHRAGRAFGLAVVNSNVTKRTRASGRIRTGYVLARTGPSVIGGIGWIGVVRAGGTPFGNSQGKPAVRGTFIARRLRVVGLRRLLRGGLARRD